MKNTYIFMIMPELLTFSFQNQPIHKTHRRFAYFSKTEYKSLCIKVQQAEFEKRTWSERRDGGKGDAIINRIYPAEVKGY